MSHIPSLRCLSCAQELRLPTYRADRAAVIAVFSCVFSKNDGTFCFCCDRRKLNAITKKTLAHFR